MKKLLILIAFIAVNHSLCWANNPQQLPTVYVVATGGTIAGSGTTGTTTAYKPGVLTVDDILQSVPELSEIANVKTLQFSNISSQDMTTELMNKLAIKVEELLEDEKVSGVVITHGTDTKEETAFFLSLTLSSSKPVVLVGSMRPSTALSADGPQNLFNAVLVAGSEESKGRGVMVAMNNKVYAARGVTKFHTTNVESFTSHNFGAIAHISDRNIDFINRQKSSLTKFKLTKSNDFPKVAILYGHSDTGADLVDFVVNSGYKGIVYAGVGHGNAAQETLNALAEASKKGVAVVRSSKVGSGSVTGNGEIDDSKFGFTSSGYLSPVQARILLMLALKQNNNDSSKAIGQFKNIRDYTDCQLDNRGLVGAYGKSDLTDAEIVVFNNAMSDYKSTKHYTPKSVTTQVVAGTNYKFICDIEGENRQAEVVIFKPLPHTGDKPSVTSIREL